MRILIIAVGRARRDPTGKLFDAYAKRLPWPIDVKEVEVRGKHGQHERRNRESQLLLEAAPKTGVTVALKPGDLVEVEIPGIGVLSNPVEAEAVA